jgi:2-C-methyl-D-erythritol 4-phosphate cytidylyltransferase / 2-C-methyl-D-erythritol 2,4-cyclodiphosphate synthase
MNISAPSPSSAIATLIVAAGRGARAGGTVPKQYQPLGGDNVLAHTLRAFGQVGTVGTILTVIHKDDEAEYEASLASSGLDPARCFACAGGETRQHSVLAGLEALEDEGFPESGIVLVHDAARPFASETVILRAVLAALQHGAAIPVLPLADTLARFDEAGHLCDNPDRAGVFRVQTPQAFRFGALLAAHRKAAAEKRFDFTDDAGVMRAAGHAVTQFAGDEALFKITQPEDFARAERVLRGETAHPSSTTFRTGIGYDVHALTAGDHVTLGGVRIAHSHALLGHSDADPVLHALTDALLGTIGDGDIGVHFPPSDARWRGAASHVFLADAARRVRAAGGTIHHVDTMILSEAPKVGPHRAAMKAAIGAVLGLAPEAIGIKATTMEGLGFIGRREGIAAMAVASVAFVNKGG